MTAENAHTFIETLSNKQIVLLRDLFEFRIRKITWDLDEILADTQTPVKQEFYKKTGFDFQDRRIDQWLALAHWAKAKGANFEEASKTEAEVWADVDVLMRAKPNLPIQTYSKLAFDHGVSQLVVTTRVPELADVTLKWLNSNYPWIDTKNIFIRSSTYMNGDVFKGHIACQHCSMIHFDDSISSATEVLKQSDANLMIFPRALEMGKFKGNDRVIEFPDMDLWFKLFGLHQDYDIARSDLAI
ncbi:hypothetical protein A2130_00765 [Candidatus Woesebacteria bacterium GWC2_33_12]|nr:MAG: hypothetical protein A2130_00765 [Candidatus Woesebacteria bacterium GWC2_33_12]HCR35604.1 hypothetical protein [Candidatus Woesebacteria bacterium]